MLPVEKNIVCKGNTDKRNNWFKCFKEGDTSLEDKLGSEKPSVVKMMPCLKRLNPN